ncbi:hypothetical protein PYCCODRAFT_1437345 [Trametes coccinea BRFM310]|uniref:Uncharacterized protein n=1 Tax=Trametes coccinea (strain BRFM310) TaxID=1353009 RepID=A0A1Y2IJT1_TRAC3|nr:hypothetical protein PYCCODRAFT_1437345 [Trametes coccinea BRFM310]
MHGVCGADLPATDQRRSGGRFAAASSSTLGRRCAVCVATVYGLATAAMPVVVAATVRVVRW